MSSSALYPLPKFSPLQRPRPVSPLPSLTLYSGRLSPVMFPHRPLSLLTSACPHPPGVHSGGPLVTQQPPCRYLVGSSSLWDQRLWESGGLQGNRLFGTFVQQVVVGV